MRTNFLGHMSYDNKIKMYRIAGCIKCHYLNTKCLAHKFSDTRACYAVILLMGFVYDYEWRCSLRKKRFILDEVGNQNQVQVQPFVIFQKQFNSHEIRSFFSLLLILSFYKVHDLDGHEDDTFMYSICRSREAPSGLFPIGYCSLCFRWRLML